MCDTLRLPVNILFNETLVTDELPQELKMSNIIPLLRGKINTALPSNYRGITFDTEYGFSERTQLC